MKKIFIVVGIIVLTVIALLVYLFFRPRAEVTGAIPGTWIIGSQRWSGEIFVDHDVNVLGNVVIEPATVVTVAAHRDVSGRESGASMEADGFNDQDPTRLSDYTKNHVSINIYGKLQAVGQEGRPIVFRSDASEPGYADWVGLYVRGNDSLIAFLELSNARHGLALGGRNQEVRNSVIRDTLWGCISAGKSESFIHDNQVSGCGHEGIDNQFGGSFRVENNVIERSHSAMVIHERNKSIIIRGNRMFREVDFAPENDAFFYPLLVMENNIIDESLSCDTDWVYENYVIPCRDNDGQPYLRP